MTRIWSESRWPLKPSRVKRQKKQQSAWTPFMSRIPWQSLGPMLFQALSVMYALGVIIRSSWSWWNLWMLAARSPYLWPPIQHTQCRSNSNGGDGCSAVGNVFLLLLFAFASKNITHSLAMAHDSSRLHVASVSILHNSMMLELVWRHFRLVPSIKFSLNHPYLLLCLVCL